MHGQQKVTKQDCGVAGTTFMWIPDAYFVKKKSH